MKQHLTYIEDDEYYEGRWALLKAYRAGSGGRLEERLQRNQACLERMMNREKEHPEKMYNLYRKATAFEAERRRKHISIHSFGKDLSKKLITKSIASVFLLPLFALAFLLDAPALLAAHLMKKTFKDNAFKNTACMVTNLFLTPLLTILWAILAFVFLPLIPAILVTIFVMVAFPIFYDCLEFFRIYISDWRLAFAPELVKAHRRLLA